MTVIDIMKVDISGDFCCGQLVGLDFEDIESILGFPANCQDDPDKVTHSWGFEVAGVRYGIWDYKGRKFSYFGPIEMMVELFGEAHVR